MSLFSRLFGGGGGDSAKPGPEPVDHNGFLIYPEPMKEAGGYRIAARVTKGEDSHHMVRADVVQSHDEAVETTLFKAKMLIDQQGDTIFR